MSRWPCEARDRCGPLGGHQPCSVQNRQSLSPGNSRPGEQDHEPLISEELRTAPRTRGRAGPPQLGERTLPLARDAAPHPQCQTAPQGSRPRPQRAVAPRRPLRGPWGHAATAEEPSLHTGHPSVPAARGGRTESARHGGWVQGGGDLVPGLGNAGRRGLHATPPPAPLPSRSLRHIPPPGWAGMGASVHSWWR